MGTREDGDTVKTTPAYLVIGDGRDGRPTIRRVTKSWPALAAREACVRLALDLPDDFLTNPVHTVAIERDEIVVAAEVEEGGGAQD
jgi:hypothetical protein